VGASGDTRRLSMYDRDLGLVAHGVKYAHVVAAVRWQLGGSWLASDQAEPLGDDGGDGADADHCSSRRERSRPYSLWLKRYSCLARLCGRSGLRRLQCQQCGW
jgi:hypothetical protein